MIVVIGSSGRFGRALQRSYSGDKIVSPSRAVYENWWQSDAQTDILEFFYPILKKSNPTVFICSGLLNTKATESDHKKINFLLPNNIITALRGTDSKIFTFGSILELFPDMDNPYVRQKRKLASLANECDPENDLCHLQIHTVYGGGLPSPFMFLGQILSSLLNKTPFNMSSGLQLREYQHIDDIVNAIRLLEKKNASGTIAISTGKPVMLKDLAVEIFSSFDQMDLLKIGSIHSWESENTETQFEPVSLPSEIMFREALENVPLYLHDCVRKVKAGEAYV